MFGDELYWRCRRSMRFNRELHEIAKTFRENELDSNDVNDNTLLPSDWTEEVVSLNCNILLENINY